MIADIKHVRIIWVERGIPGFGTCRFIFVSETVAGSERSTRDCNLSPILLRALKPVGKPVVSGQGVDLSCGLIVIAAPSLSAVQADQGAMVLTIDDSVAVIGIDPKIMVVAINPIDVPKAFTAILANKKLFS